MVAQARIFDIHSHILPGIDDGAQIFADSINLVKELTRQGITDIIATPHYVNETSFVSPFENNRKLFLDLKNELALQDIHVNIYLGNEVYIDHNILDLLKSGKISTLAGSKYLLIELPLNDEFPNYEEYFREIMENGYKVILAHPERYSVVQEDYGVAEDLCESGILLQCNFGSIMGKYGRQAYKTVKNLAKDKMIFAFGSDIHHCRGDNYYAKAISKLAKIYNEDELKNVLFNNPAKIIK